MLIKKMAPVALREEVNKDKQIIQEPLQIKAKTLREGVAGGTR
ncbi:MAG: hypothetical protein SFV22_11745 [Saprospiraceae bacterium]|nr:hypothetical protein [Saprospiraceae bacterium]